jgi:ubiquinone/menaquinone biosynthesis C-methylase UbiE
MPGVNEFDKNVDQYEQWFVDNPLAYVSELRAVRELVPTNSNGIEIGLGTGRFAAPLGITRGIEPSRSMAELARKKGIEVVAGVAEHLPFTDNEFGFVLMVTTVCFLDDMDMALREVRRVLKPGGALVIGFVDRDSPLGKDYQARKDTSAFYQHATFYTTKDIAAALEKAGFGAFEYRQTLFQPLETMAEVEPVKEGYGQGSFVVVRAEKK